MSVGIGSTRAALASLFSLVAFSFQAHAAKDVGGDVLGVGAGANDVPATTPSNGVSAFARVSGQTLVRGRSVRGFGGEILITGRAADGFNQLTIDVGDPDIDFTIDRFSSPERLVIDLPSGNAYPNTQVPVRQLKLVTGLKVIRQPGVNRIVVDLSAGEVASHDARVVDGKLVVTLKGAAVIAGNGVVRNQGRARWSYGKLPDAEPLGRVEEKESEPSPNAVAFEDIPELAEEQPLAGKKESAAEPVAALPEKKSASPKVAEVQSLAFNPEVNRIELSLEGEPEYKITRTAPSEYVLTLKRTALDEGVSQEPFFPQSPSTGIRSMRPVTQGEDTVVRIFTQPSSYLTARRAGNVVLIEETSNMKVVSQDLRAAIDPSKSAEGAVEEAPAKNPRRDGAEGARKNGTKEASAAPETYEGNDFAKLLDDSARYTGRLISLDLQDTDIDNALRIIAEVSNLNIVASDEVAGKVTLRLTDVPWDQALDVILKTHGLDKVLEGNVMRIAPVEKLRSERETLKQARQAEEDLEPLGVKYFRVSYAKAAEIKSLVETVLSERGTVAYDERSNQLIVKDVRGGLINVVELIKKVDLRTPQVLLETQIVEANRNLTRELGSQLGFQYIQSPATGNGTGLNFPAAVSVGGSVTPNAPGSITGSSFPAAVAASAGSAISMLFDSADGTRSLELRLSQLEQEGKIRIISRPAVATTNNKPAEIKSVEKLRVKLPSGGLSVATGSGAQASGAGTVATQTIEAGITLSVTPQASPDYYVLLDIRANSSSFGSRVVDGIPNEIARSASSTVLVSSGQTFALGGIYKIVEKDDVSGVPFFKDIPFLGTFFRKTSTDTSDEELLFFITPRIVEGSFDDASIKSDM